MLQQKRLKNLSKLQFFFTLGVLTIFAVSVLNMASRMLIANFKEVGKNNSEFVYRFLEQEMVKDYEYGNVIIENDFVRKYVDMPDEMVITFYANYYLQEVSDEVEDIESMAIISYSQPDEYLSSDGSKHIILQDKTYFESHEYYISPFNTDNSEDTIYYVQMPIRMNDTIKGIVSLEVSYHEFEKRFINENQYHETGAFQIAGMNGNVLLKSCETLPVTYDSDILLNAIREKGGIARIDNQYYYANIRSFHSQDLIFIYSQGKTELFEIRSRILLQIVFAYLGVIIVYTILHFLSDVYYSHRILEDTKIVLEETVEAKTEVLKRQIRLDSLTQIYNHAFLIELLDEVLLSDREVTVMMLDIDYFKQINDNYGHPVGDQVLKEISHLLLDSIRTEDSVGRYGGEEFMIILRDTDLEVGYRVAERIRKDINAKAFSENEIKATMSIGLAQATNETSLELIKKADRKLYESKNNGRNLTTK